MFTKSAALLNRSIGKQTRIVGAASSQLHYTRCIRAAGVDWCMDMRGYSFLTP